MQPEYAQSYADLYYKHWWWRARRDAIMAQVRRLDLPEHVDSLDVGCGSGLLLPVLATMGSVRGIEIDTSLLDDDTPCRDRIHTQPLGSPIYRDMQFDFITALDVVEHIENDQTAIEQMMAMLRPGGKLLVTVPALPALWDEHDRINQHYRRYTARSLNRLLGERGRVLELRYLFHWLVAPKLAVKAANLFRSRQIAQHTIPTPWINDLCEWLCKTEQKALSWARLPWGTSLLAVVEKPIKIAARQPLRLSLGAA